MRARAFASAGDKPVLAAAQPRSGRIGQTLPMAFSYVGAATRSAKCGSLPVTTGQTARNPRAGSEKCVRDALNFDPKYGAGADSYPLLLAAACGSH